MKELPEGMVAYKQTAVFTESTVPAGLLRRHTTKAGTWGKIVVLSGRLRYRILVDPIEEHELSPGRPGVVEEQVPHEVEPLGPVSFYVEFHRRPGADDGSPEEAR